MKEGGECARARTSERASKREQMGPALSFFLSPRTGPAPCGAAHARSASTHCLRLGSPRGCGARPCRAGATEVEKGGAARSTTTRPRRCPPRRGRPPGRRRMRWRVGGWRWRTCHHCQRRRRGRGRGAASRERGTKCLWRPTTVVNLHQKNPRSPRFLNSLAPWSSCRSPCALSSYPHRRVPALSAAASPPAAGIHQNQRMRQLPHLAASCLPSRRPTRPQPSLS
jgi:hypothetical protein